MTLYVRGYEDYSYEIIYLDGIVRKRRFHLLINPSIHLKLPGQGDEKKDPVLNIESLTHILAMETSIAKKDLIKRTTHIAERTNKPIITNPDTAEYFKQEGLSIKQLRILGFQEEIVDDLKIDPIYIEELSDDIPKEEKSPNILTMGKNMFDKVNPLNWKSVKKITGLVLDHDDETTYDIDPTKPVGFKIEFSGDTDIVLLCDKRGTSNVNRILSQICPTYLIVLNQQVSFTKEIQKGPKRVIILNGKVGDDDLLVIPKTYNKTVPHDTYYGALEQWIDLED